VVLISVFIIPVSVISKEAAGSGTCCDQLTSTCVIDGVRVDDKYLKDGAGPCP